ncbi:MAG TPA: FAD-dependent oxidoreductase, partial [Longimicrobiales bacterium]|nr:FAD-dependent oxidoreductase [Longimicrobiales bacterium]
DVRRLRALSAERNALLRNAAHLVHPVPVAVPTYGLGRDGKPALQAGLGLYDLLTARRNDGIADPVRRLAPSRMIGRDTVLEMFPGLPAARLSGAAIFSDAQLHDPARFALAVLRAAVEAGAQAANGLEATGIVRKGITVTGIGVRTREGGDAFVIQGRTVVNTAGAWAERILEEGLGLTFDPPLHFFRRVSLVVNRRPTHRMGLALLDQSRDSDTPLSRSKRHLFVLPRRDQLVLGEWRRDYSGVPEEAYLTDQEVETCVAEINGRHPGLRLNPSEVVRKNVALGLLEPPRRRTEHAREAAGARLIDHSVAHGMRGMVSLVGATWGTARMDAARVVDDVFRRFGTSGPPSAASSMQVYGGDVESLEDVVREAHEMGLQWGFSRDRASDLVRNHGTGYKEVFDLVREDPTLAGSLPGTRIPRAEVVHAVRSEMALTLDDLVHRRTDLGLGVRPVPAIEEAAYLMSGELGWSAGRTRREVARVRASTSTEPAPVAEHAQG